MYDEKGIGWYNVLPAACNCMRMRRRGGKADVGLSGFSGNACAGGKLGIY